MHEMSIVDNLMQVINNQMTEHNIQQLNKVKIVVGELTGIVPETLEFCWQVYTEDSPYRGAQLEIEKLPAIAVCNKCANEYLINESPSCPKCGGGIKAIVSGKELFVDYIEGE